MTTSLADGGSRPAVAELVRTRLTTTPSRLRLESVVIIGLAVITGLLASFVVGDQLAATREIKDESAPAIVSARQIQTSLAEANAAASVAFLAGGVEDPGQREIYTGSLAEAADELEQAARLVGDDEAAHDALETITVALPRYAGLVESARANNRQGFPVGAAYLSSATSLLDDEIYVATDEVANRAAARYRQAYDRQRGVELALGIVVAALAAVLAAALLAAQFQLWRRFRRTLNAPMVLATVLTVALAVWLGVGFASHSSHLASARTDGYIGTRLYLDLRSSAFGAKADEAQFLIARGAGEGFETSFAQRAERIEGFRAELDSHAADSDHPISSGRELDATYEAWDAYAELHDGVVVADRDGEREGAVETALGPSVASFAEVDQATGEALGENRARFESEMAAAERSLRGLRFGSLLLCVAIAALTALGIQLRINEYR